MQQITLAMRPVAPCRVGLALPIGPKTAGQALPYVCHPAVIRCRMVEGKELGRPIAGAKRCGTDGR